MNGILLVNKPKGITSHDVVAKVRKVFKMKAVGHAGTLDPMAQGLLIILLGEATKFSNYIMGQDKHYVAEIQLGLKTDTWDAEGDAIPKSLPDISDGSTLNSASSKDETYKIDFTKQEILKCVNQLVGNVPLEVPVYSAVKINGKKLYDYARQGQNITTPVREMMFYSAEVLEFASAIYEHKNIAYKTLRLVVDLKCEKGSYIRSWVHHFGKNLGSAAIMSDLVRHKSGKYLLSDAVDYSKLNDLHFQLQEEVQFKKDSSISDQMLLEITKHIKEIKDSIEGPFYRIHDHELRLIKNGQIPKDLNLRIRPHVKNCFFNNETKLIRVYDSKLENLIAVLELTPNSHPKILRAFQSTP